MKFVDLSAVSRLKGKIVPDFNSFQELPQKWFGKSMAQYSAEVALYISKSIPGSESSTETAEIDVSEFLEEGKCAFFVEISGLYKLDGDAIYQITRSDENLIVDIFDNVIYLSLVRDTIVISGYLKSLTVYLNAKFYIDDAPSM
jgi:hypothetical protein